MVLLVNSERSGQRVLASRTGWLAQPLKVRVNATKSGVHKPGGGTCLGFQRDAAGHTQPTAPGLARVKAKGRDCGNARRAHPLPARIAAWQRYGRRWWNYFRVVYDYCCSWI